jgi:phenylpropionate dioxygenase-like ring-hydroxylating dioxygenase large terminal subunit
MIADRVMLDDWHAVARSDEVYGDRLVGRVLLEEDIVLWRSAEGLRAWQDRCPHRGAKLSLGQVRGPDRVGCPYHGWQFDPEGRCRLTPAAPGAAPPSKAVVRGYRVAEAHGLVWVSLGEPTGGPPDLAEADAGYELVVTGPYAIATSGPRAIENFLDMAHFAFVHRGWLGAEPHTEIPDYAVETDESGVSVRDFKVWQPRSNALSEGGAMVAYSYHVPRPLTALLTKEPGAAGEKPAEIIMITVAPQAETQVTAWFVLAMTYAKGQPHRRFVDFQDAIFLQDKAVLESQRPQRLPLDPAAEQHQLCDRSALAYRRWLQRLGMTYGVIPAAARRARQ